MFPVNERCPAVEISYRVASICMFCLRCGILAALQATTVGSLPLAKNAQHSPTSNYSILLHFTVCTPPLSFPWVSIYATDTAHEMGHFLPKLRLQPVRGVRYRYRMETCNRTSSSLHHFIILRKAYIHGQAKVPEE